MQVQQVGQHDVGLVVVQERPVGGDGGAPCADQP
jgi:hypothetical protein